MKKRPCPKHAQKDPFLVLADLRRRQEKLRSEEKREAVTRVAAVKKKIAGWWEDGNARRMGATNDPAIFQRLFFPGPGPMPDILKANWGGW